MQSVSQAVPEDGRWLAAEGPYRDHIAAWCELNPNLKSPDSKNRWSPLQVGNARVVLLEIGHGERAKRTEFSDAATLSGHLALSSAEGAVGTPSNGRIYLMEGLAPDFIAVLGGHFFMDPRFFMDQERTTRWGLSHEGSKHTSSLPSLINPEKMFLLRYCELRDFGTIKSFSTWCARTSRNISVTRNTRPDLYDIKFEPIGIVQRKCSFWSRKDKNGWVVVILCDPPVEKAFVQMEEQTKDHSLGSKYSNWLPKIPSLQVIQNTPFSGGYLDFIKRSELSQSPVAGPPRTSMLEDLCFYLDEYGAYLTENCNPISTITPALFMQKIVASHYMQLVEFVRANIYNLEYQLGRRNTLTEIHTPWIEERWSDLQTWSRRCSEYVEDVEAIMIGLGIPFSTSFVCDSMPPDWQRCDKDFQYIHYRLKFLKAHVVSVNNSITGLAGIAGNQQALCEAKRSLKEAKAVKTLTLLGMVFIPLAFCNGLFSMSDQYLPGKSSFWIYWATSIPLIVAIFFIAFLINLGYNIQGGWDLVTLLETLRRGRV